MKYFVGQTLVHRNQRDFKIVIMEAMPNAGQYSIKTDIDFTFTVGEAFLDKEYVAVRNTTEITYNLPYEG